MKAKFYDNIEDSLLKFAVIIAKYENRYIFCKHKDRDTLEIPGGHREHGEDIIKTAKRELYEETGAVKFDLKPVCVYSVVDGNDETFGMLYYADVAEYEKQLHNEIEKIILLESLPEVNKWTYPMTQPMCVSEARRRGIF